MGCSPVSKRKWREDESSPYTGKRSARPEGKPGFSIAKESVRRSLPRHSFTATAKNTEASVCVFEAWRNLSGPMGLNFKNQIQNQIPGRDQTASRWSAPSPGKRTRREEHALSHRPQMSSGRLFLDRVGRHQSPSLLRRHAQTITHFPRGTSKPELSTLLGSGTFYFALTRDICGISRVAYTMGGNAPDQFMTVADIDGCENIEISG